MASPVDDHKVDGRLIKLCLSTVFAVDFVIGIAVLISQ